MARGRQFSLSLIGQGAIFSRNFPRTRKTLIILAFCTFLYRFGFLGFISKHSQIRSKVFQDKTLPFRGIGSSPNPKSLPIMSFILKDPVVGLLYFELFSKFSVCTEIELFSHTVCTWQWVWCRWVWVETEQLSHSVWTEAHFLCSFISWISEMYSTTASRIKCFNMVGNGS